MPAVQESVVHGLLSLQLMLVPGLHTPVWQSSTPLHTLPSLQEAPLVTGWWKQPEEGLHRSVVQ
jgi:hypothetical protein